MFGVVLARYGYAENGRKYAFIVYGEKGKYCFVLLSGEPHYNSFFTIDGDFDFAKMCDNTRLIESYTYTNDEEFLLAIKKARRDWLEYTNPDFTILID